MRPKNIFWTMLSSAVFCISAFAGLPASSGGPLPSEVAAERGAFGAQASLSTEEFVSVRGEYTDYFSTVCTVFLYVPAAEEARAREACTAVEEAFARIDRSVSVSRSDSEIYYFNRVLKPGESMEISADTYALLSEALEMYERTEGAYDPSVARLVDLWGFSPRFNDDDSAIVEEYDREDYQNSLPDERYIEAFRQLAAFEEVSFGEQENGGYYLTKPQRTAEVDNKIYDVWLDLGGIAKGYACDVAAEILKSYGFSYGYVSVGRSSMYVLQNAAASNGAYDVYIRNPRAEESGQNGELMAKLQAKDCGLSTSGDYERYYVIHNRRYCHIISAETGEPIETGVCTAFVTGGSAAECDALTTALCVMGKDKATDFILNELSGYKALFVWENRSTGKYEIIANCEREEISLESGANDFEICGYLQDGEFIYRPSSAFDWVQLTIGIGLTVVVVGVIAGLGYRNHVLKRNKAGSEK